MRNFVLASGLSTVGTGWQDLASLWSSSAVVKRVEGAQSSPSGFPQTLASSPNRQGHLFGAAHPQLPALPASQPWHEPLLCSRELSPAGSWCLPKAGGHFFLYSLWVEQLKGRVPASLGQSLPQLISPWPVPGSEPSLADQAARGVSFPGKPASVAGTGPISLESFLGRTIPCRILLGASRVPLLLVQHTITFLDIPP